MSKKKKQLFQDIFLIIVSIIFAFILVKTGLINKFVSSLGSLGWIGTILAGMFFTFAFTAAPSVVLLGELAKNTPLIFLGVLGGLGAVLGDYIIFRFVKDRISSDLEYILCISGNKNRFLNIFKTTIFKFLLPFLGALIIASPLPDEIGVALLGFSKLDNKVFFILSFVLNGIGVLLIGFLAKLL